MTICKAKGNFTASWPHSARLPSAAPPPSPSPRATHSPPRPTSSRRAGGHVIVTASCLGVYPLHALPLYSATKHALVGFVRSTAPVFKHALGIAINAILPNMVETNLMPEAFRPEWDPLKMTPMSTVLRAVDKILTDESVHGATIELCKDELVFSGPQAYATSNSKWVVEENVLLWERAMEVVLPRAAGQNVAMKQ